MLTVKYIRTLYVLKKLTDRFLGLFKVLSRKGQNTYILELYQKYGRLYPTFYISLLEPYRIREGYKTPTPIDINGEEEQEVKYILNLKELKHSVKRYLIRQKGYSKADNTWEVKKNLKNV